MVARALMREPGLLLADEPVASLDPESSAQVMRLLARVAQEWIPVDMLPELHGGAGDRAQPAGVAGGDLSRDAASGRAVMCSFSWSRPDSIRIIVELDGPAATP